jgi:hypothetical protein
MQFIKNLWNKVKSFFSNLFSRKEVAKIEAATAITEVPVVAEVAVETNTVAEVAAESQEDKAERIHGLFNRIMEIAKFRNYSLTEAFQAAKEGDEATLVRIEREMNHKTYKAPKHNRAKRKAA